MGRNTQNFPQQGEDPPQLQVGNKNWEGDAMFWYLWVQEHGKKEACYKVVGSGVDRKKNGNSIVSLPKLLIIPCHWSEYGANDECNGPYNLFPIYLQRLNSRSWKEGEPKFECSSG